MEEALQQKLGKQNEYSEKQKAQISNLNKQLLKLKTENEFKEAKLSQIQGLKLTLDKKINDQSAEISKLKSSSKTY